MLELSELKEREWWSPNEAARVLGGGRMSWYHLCRSGKVKYTKRGRHYKINAESARAYMDGQSVQAGFVSRRDFDSSDVMENFRRKITAGA